MKNNIDLVTVTFSGDCSMQKFQSYSVDKMITTPCNHYVIVEDDKIPLEKWYSFLSPYYSKHKLHLIPGKSLLPEKYYNNDSKLCNGWHRQNALKLLISDQIHSDKYLIIDSKNFFICRQSLNTWPITEGNGLLVDTQLHITNRWAELDNFCLNHNIKVPSKVYDASTPFVVHTDTVKKIIQFDILPLFFDKKNWWVSEFYLYSFFIQHFGNRLQSVDVTNVTFWDTKHSMSVENLRDILKWPNIKSLGLHRDMLKLNINLDGLFDFLVEIGFDKKTVEDMLKQNQESIIEY